MTNQNRMIVLKSRPDGMPDPSHYEQIAATIPQTPEGGVLIKHSHLGLAPAARLRMANKKVYASRTEIGEPIYGQALGAVIESNNADFPVGSQVVTMDGGWQDYSVSRGKNLFPVSPSIGRPSLYLGLLGTSGFTAYSGLHFIGHIAAGETVVVSAAAGAVGAAAVQMAQLHGCRVVGIASGAEKCGFVLNELGAFACVDRNAPNFEAILAEACPDGVDVYFDNAGGAVRDAVWPLMRTFGRIVVCGQIASYNALEADTGPSWMKLLAERLTIQGFLLRDHMPKREEFLSAMATWLSAGQIDQKEETWNGLESAPAAFSAMLGGRTFGKVIVAL